MTPEPARGQRLYRVLLALYPKRFRAELGESMTQTFADLAREPANRHGVGRLVFLLSTYADTLAGVAREHWHTLARPANGRTPMPSNPRTAALTGLLLALPFAGMFVLLVLGIEPPLGPLSPILRGPVNGPNVLGTAIVLGAWLLALAGFVINLRPLIGVVRAGLGVGARPLNLVLGLAIFATLALFIAAIIVDQYPCWVGVPNCD